MWELVTPTPARLILSLIFGQRSLVLIVYLVLRRDGLLGVSKLSRNGTTNCWKMVTHRSPEFVSFTLWELNKLHSLILLIRSGIPDWRRMRVRNGSPCQINRIYRFPHISINHSYIQLHARERWCYHSRKLRMTWNWMLNCWLSRLRPLVPMYGISTVTVMCQADVLVIKQITLKFHWECTPLVYL